LRAARSWSRSSVTPVPDRLAATVREASALDHAVYAAVAATRTPSIDGELAALSRAADHSKLWLGCAAGLALGGGPRGRRAAVRGLAAIAVASGGVNLGVKLLSRRRRPDRAGVPEARHVPMPISTSFPSGHAASAFAFAYAVGRHLPALAVPIRLLATAVAYSRVHTGVHYPGDVVIGSVTGAGTAAMVAAVADRAARRRTT
jgi:membrane-associated phospholipid phosphatase